ncbi:hypothetical protein ACFVWG_12430 [Kribbella sp. NPDC058245]|uniref:hypothetical protein n=1 Tax=Kribbella sp. NPDC058245 TaxID=3346399 RepID=UPI0036EEB259
MGRGEISEPFGISFANKPVPALRFLLQEGFKPSGVVEHLPDGLTLGMTPWFTEVVFELTGTEAVAVLYRISKDDEYDLVVACLGEIVEPFFRLLEGRDYGDELSKLVKLHWPEQYEMLRLSTAQVPGARVMFTVHTPQRAQWVVADHLRVGDEFSSAQVTSLIGAALQTFLRFCQPYDLPGIIPVLGGPDLVSRRLKSISGMISSLNGINGALKDGFDAGDIIDLAKDAWEFLQGADELRRSRK